MLHKRPSESKQKKTSLQNDQQLLDRVKQAVTDIGLPRVTAVGVVSKLKANADQNRVPSVTTVRLILMKQFGLKFRAANAAKIKYNDTDFDLKRLWVSRLLAQFMMAGVVIVSIDESSFK